MARDYISPVDEDDLYEAMQRRGAGPITAARIVNVSREDEAKHLSHVPYEKRVKKDLYARARELGIAGRSSMTREELIEALRAT